MKIIIFGSTGSVGRHLVEQALKMGHGVTAFARNPYALDVEHENLKLVAGDAHDPVSVSQAMNGHDVVLVTLGSSSLSSRVRSIGTFNIIKAMKVNGIKRLICQSTLGVGASRENLNFFWKYLMFGFILRKPYDDHVVQEALVQQSKLNWTIVRPSSFTDELNLGDFKQGFGPNERGLSLKISRSEVASFMLQQVSCGKYLHQTPAISY